MNPKGFLLFFIFLLSISIVFSQQNVITITEPFSTVYGEFNYSQLNNITKSGSSTSQYMDFGSGRWFVGNLMGTEGQHPTNPQNVSSNVYWNVSGSQLKLVAGRQQTTPTYDQGFVFLITEPFSIKSDTYFHFDMNTSSTLDIGLLFLDQFNDCKLLIEGDDTGSSDFVSSSYCGWDSYDICAMDNQTPGLGIQSYEVIFGECGFSDKSNINKVVVLTSEGGPGDTVAYIDNLILGNIYNGSNYMPSLNLTINGTRFCMDGTDITINYTKQWYDPENDTLLYTVGSTVNLGNTSNYVDYHWSSLLNEPDMYSIFPQEDKLYVNSEVCVVSHDNNVYNSSTHNFETYKTKNDEVLWGLGLNGPCAILDSKDDSGYYYKIKPTINLNYETLIYKWNLYDGMNISYYSDSMQELFQLTLEYDDANDVTTLYHKGTWLGNVTADYNQQIKVTIFADYMQYNVTLNGGSVIMDKNITGTPNSDMVRWIAVTPHWVVGGNSASFVQANFMYYGNLGALVWSETTNSSITFTTPGYHEIIMYYTDTEHDTEFNKVTKGIYIYPSDKCYMITGGIGQEEDAVTRIDPLGALKGIFGKNFRDYLVTLGYYETGKVFLWWIWVLLLLGISVMLIMRGGQLSLSIPLIVASVSCGFLALMLGYTQHLVVFLIGLAFGLAGPLSNSYGGG